MKASSRAVRIAVASLLIALAAAGFARAGDDEEEGEAHLPLTIERVWFKTTNKLLNSSGDLTIAHDSIEFVTGKKTIVYPLEEIYVLSYGQFKSDVDTEWVVLGVGESGPAQLIAIRDGKKFGYGTRTPDIYKSMRSALRQLGAAQYDVPEGFEPYDSFSIQCSLAIPVGWDAHLDSLVVQADGHSWGTTFFSSKQIEYAHREAGQTSPVRQDPALQAVLSGDTSAFFLARSEIEKGMNCNGFSDKAKDRLIARERSRTTDVMGYELIEPFEIEPAAIGFCNGFHATGRSRRPDGLEVRIDLYVVANRKTLYVMGHRAVDETFEASQPFFETAVSTLRFSVAR